MICGQLTTSRPKRNISFSKKAWRCPAVRLIVSCIKYIHVQVHVMAQNWNRTSLYNWTAASPCWWVLYEHNWWLSNKIWEICQHGSFKPHPSALLEATMTLQCHGYAWARNSNNSTSEAPVEQNYGTMVRSRHAAVMLESTQHRPGFLVRGLTKVLKILLVKEFSTNIGGLEDKWFKKCTSTVVQFSKLDYSNLLFYIVIHPIPHIYIYNIYIIYIYIYIVFQYGYIPTFDPPLNGSFPCSRLTSWLQSAQCLLLGTTAMCLSPAGCGHCFRGRRAPLQDTKVVGVNQSATEMGKMGEQWDYIILYLYIYIYTHTYTCMRTYVDTCTRTYVRTNVHTYMRAKVHMYIRTYVNTCIRTWYIHTYVRTYVHTCTRTYIRTHVHTYMPCKSTYVHTYIRTYIRTYVHTYTCTYVHTYIRTYVHTNLRTYVHTYLRTYLHTYIRTYVHTFIPTYLHNTCIPTSLHTYKPTNLQTYRPTNLQIYNLQTYKPTNLHLHTYIATYLPTWSHADICPWVICSFCHFFIFIFLQPLQHFVPYAKMKCAFRCGFSTQRCIFHWYLHDFMALILPDSCSLKSSFLICSFGRQSMIAANSLVRLAWFGKLLRQTKPQTYNISLGPDHHQAFLWPAKTVAKPSLSYATNGLCIECLSPQNQAFSWRLLFSQTHVCCASHETFQHEVCFEYTINHYQPLSSTMNLHEPSLTTISHWKPLLSAILNHYH